MYPDYILANIHGVDDQLIDSISDVLYTNGYFKYWTFLKVKVNTYDVVIYFKLKDTDIKLELTIDWLYEYKIRMIKDGLDILSLTHKD